MQNRLFLSVLFCFALFLTTGTLYAQNQRLSLQAEVGIGSYAPNKQKPAFSFLLFPHPQKSQADSTRISPQVPMPQSDPADIDPGIWIKPDSTIDAKIMHLTPRADVDPKMILPTLPHKQRRK